MSNDYYEEYLAKTNDNLSESTLLKQEKEKKSSSKKTILLSLLFLVLAGEGFYLWQKNQAAQNNVDNPTEALLPMTKPTITILDTNHSIEENMSKPLVKITPIIIEKNVTKPIVKVIPVTVEKNVSKAIIKVIPITVEKNVTKPIIKVVSKIHPLEKSLLNPNNTKKISMKNGKKIDTFNKIILDRTLSKGNENSQKISQILEEAKKKKQEAEKEKEEKAKEEKKILPKKKTNSYTNAIKKEAKVRKNEMRYVTVRSGDSLYKIAKRIYGDSTKFDIIFKANSDILKKATNLSIGQKLRVPKLKKAQ